MAEFRTVTLKHDTPMRALVQDVVTKELFWLEKQVSVEAANTVSFGVFSVKDDDLTLVGNDVSIRDMVFAAAVSIDDAVNALLYEGVIDPNTPLQNVRDALLRRGIVAILPSSDEGSPPAIEPPSVFIGGANKNVVEEDNNDEN